MRARGWLLAMMLAGTSTAQTAPAWWTQQWSGLFKELASGSRFYVTQEAWGDNMDRLRLTYDGKRRDWLAVHVEYDNELHGGNLTTLPDFAIVRERQSAAWIGARHVLVDEPHAYWDTSLYRGTVSLRGGPATLTVGRQRIGWGTARFWSPMDMFNPISPLQVEAEEREGVDAGLLAFRTAGSMRWNVVYAPEDGFRRSTSAVRLSRTIHNYDFDAAAARFGRDWVTGFDFAGQLRGAGLRGETTYRWRHPEAGAAAVSRRNALRLMAGADYAFASGLYVVGEYFYNRAEPDVKGGDFTELLQTSSEIFTVHRHFISAGASYPVTPLWKVETYVVMDAGGRSAAVLPKVSHNLTANTDLNIGAQFFASSREGEFHGLADLAYVELVVHFR